MYKDFAESERIANVERILMNGLLQFTHGTTRKNAELAIEFEKRQGKHLDFESILQGSLNSERVYGTPTMPLPYNTPLNPATMVYNVRTEPVDRIYGPAPLVRTGIDIGGILQPPYFRDSIVSHQPQYRNFPSSSDPVEPKYVPRAQAQDQIRADQAGVQAQPVIQQIAQQAIAAGGRQDSFNEYRDPTRSVRSASHSSNDELTRTMSNLSMEDDTFHDAAATSTPMNIDQVRRSGRQTSVPARLGINTNVFSEQIEPLLEKVVETYFIKSKKEQNRGRSKERKSSRGRKNSKEWRKDKRPGSKVNYSSGERRDRSKSYGRSRDHRRNDSSDKFKRNSRSSSQGRSFSRNTRRRSYSSTNFSENRDKRSLDRQRGNSNNRRDKSENRYKRDISNNRKWNDKDMNKGINCSADYKPRYEFVVLSV